MVDTAWRLFADRGFDDVTVTEVAREAQVAKATVFNYFPAKEDLFFPGWRTSGPGWWRRSPRGRVLADDRPARLAAARCTDRTAGHATHGRRDA
ncbi:MAG: helix-turn-helix domain-containing protein [Actinoallomurus sp.]